MAVPAPELIGHGGWIGTPGPLSLASLRGKVVLLHFWSLSCAGCEQVLDDLRRLADRHAGEIAVVSVHSPKFPHTGRHDTLVRAVDRLRIDHPVLDDPELVTWQQYGVRGWPTVVIVDPRGHVVGALPGSGTADALERVVRDVLTEHRGALRPGPPPGRAGAAPAGPTGRTDRLSHPDKVATDRRGRIVVADTGNDRVLVASLTGADTARVTHVVTGLDRPHGVRLYGTDLVVCDTGNGRLLRLDLARRPGPDDPAVRHGAVARLLARPGEAVATGLAAPWDVVADRDRSFVVAEAAGHRLWRASLDGTSPAVVAGTGFQGLVDGRAGEAELAQPSGLARVPGGVAFVDAESSALRLLADRGRVGTVVGVGLFDWGRRDGRAGTARLQHPEGLAVAPDGRTLFVADTFNNRLCAWTGSRLVTIPVAGLDEPSGLDVLPDGRLVVADRGNHRLVVVDPVAATLQPLALHLPPA